MNLIQQYIYRYIKPRKLIVVADDLGLHPDINRGIIKAMTQGFVTTTSLMVYAPGIDDALDLIETHSIKNIGIHLTLQAINPSKILHTSDYNDILKKHNHKEIEKLVLKELKRFEKLISTKPKHITPHQGIHGNLKVLKTIIKYAKQHNIPVRIPRTTLNGDIETTNYTAEILIKRNNIKHPDYIFAEIQGADILQIKQNLMQKLKTVQYGAVAEMIFHPGYFTKDIIDITSLTYERSRDLSLLTDKSFFNDIKSLGFKLINYKQI